MSLSTIREPTVVLMDYTTYTPWIHQLETRSASLDVWDQIDPTQIVLPRTKPRLPVAPDITKYERKPSLGLDEHRVPLLPETPSELSPNGLKAWKEDNDYWKSRLEAYKIANREYREEQANMDKVVMFIQHSVSPHLMKNCCKLGEPIRAWLISLKQTVGIDAEEERLQARHRYLAALKPMRQPGSWDTWLLEYDHAATNAETEGVAEIYNIQDTVQDFLDSVMKIAPTWATTFQDYGRRELNMTRKEMMKRFQEHISKYHPKGRQQRGAFAAGNTSTLTASSESTPDTDRDASHVNECASSTPTTQGSQGRPCQKRSIGQSTTSRQSLTRDTAAAGGAKCPACRQRHRLDNCYYVYKEKALEWFTPRDGIAEMVQFQLEQNADLQDQVRSAKRARTKTPAIKMSQTPEVSLE
jgi:hypothetical protein